jgi:hypothetical protein
MNRFALLVAVLCLSPLPALADEVVVGTSSGDIVDYNTATGASTVLGTSSTVVFGLGYSGGVLYANDNGSAPATGFYTVNASNGALTFINNIGNASTSGTGAITSVAGGGTLYFFDHSNNLYTINTATGAATLIGSLGFTVSGSWDIGFAPNGNLYATSNGFFYQINPATGASTFLGDSGQQMQGLVAGDGNLYGFSGTSMYDINLSDGALTFVRNTPSGIGNFETGTDLEAATTPTPEPSVLVTLLCGLVLLASFSIWRRPKIAIA